MKRRAPYFWLFALPLLVPLFLFGTQKWQRTQVTNYDVGGFKNSSAGERIAVRKLAHIMTEGRDKGQIRIMWNDVKPALKPTSQRPTEIWFYGFFYDQQNNRLTQYTLSPRSTDPRQVEAVQYYGVSDVVISSTANNKGTLQDLVRNGASLRHRGKAKFDEEEGLIFEK